jgi:protein involved in polysaccharide export with SLBB domain
MSQGQRTIPPSRACSGVLAAALAGVLLACTSTPPPAPSDPAPDATPSGLRAGDAVQVSVWREEDLSGTFTIDDRGIVTLPLLGERRVAGVPATELRDALLTDYREYLQNPSIEVAVLRRVTVLGSVGQPGLYTVDTTMSLREAIGLAGGVAPTGDAKDIRLLRDGRVVRTMLDGSASIGAVDIRSGDEIVVGERSWLERNSGTLLGSLIAAAAVITTALIR